MGLRAAIAWVLVIAAGVRGQPSIVQVDGGAPARVLVTAATDAPAEPAAEAPMARRAAGLLGVLDGSEVNRLIGALPLNPAPAPPSQGAERVVVLHLIGRDGTRRMVDIARIADGGLVLRDVERLNAEMPRVTLDRDRIAPLMNHWSGYRGLVRGVPDGLTLGAAFELEHPLEPSPILLDALTLRERVYRGMNLDAKPAARDLDTATLIVRLPKSYTPRTPAGLMVWIDPEPAGVPPREFDAALDELGLIAVGAANAGNDRDPSDRMQLALDAVASVRTRFHVDDRRVYVTGMSGGGRIAAMLWGAFPEVFRGAVPICGMAAYRVAPAEAGKVWPAMFARPAGSLLTRLKSSRLAAITGSSDFNAPNVEAYVRVLATDGMAVRVFKHADMGHELPSAARFAEALRWVDEPARGEREDAAKRASVLLRRVEAGLGEAAPALRQREQLERVLTVAPWSEPAWRALELLERR